MTETPIHHSFVFARSWRAIHSTWSAKAMAPRWLAEHNADELAEVAAPFFPEIARDVLVTSLGRYLQAGIWSRSPEVSQEGFARLADSLLSGRFISRLPAYADCVDQSLD